MPFQELDQDTASTSTHRQKAFITVIVKKPSIQPDVGLLLTTNTAGEIEWTRDPPRTLSSL